MHYFSDLGARIGRAWDRADRDVDAFADVATAALRARPPAHHVCADDIVDWVLAARELPAQVNLAASFGQPPVTVYRGDGFYIEALFWHSSTTAIHQHAFAGAFSVLSGASVESRFAFDERCRFDDEVLLGELSLSEVAVLSPGDVRTIARGDALIHSVFHLDSPSVTVVARTLQDAADVPQYSYLRPGLAIDPFAVDEVRDRRLQIVEMLADTGSARYPDAARAAMVASSPRSAVGLLELEARRSPDSPLWSELLDRAVAAHGVRFADVAPAFAYLRRELLLTSRRDVVVDPDLRFFLALLIALPTRDEVERTIAGRFPGIAPRALITRWCEALSGTDVCGVEFDELNLVLLECLLDGRTFAGAVSRLRDEYDDDDVDASVDQLADHYAALRSSPIFEPLFR